MSQRAPKWKHKRPANIAGYSDEYDTAAELGLTIYTLRSWRQRRIGPPWTKVGRHIFYNNDSRAAWLRSGEIRPVREQTAA